MTLKTHATVKLTSKLHIQNASVIDPLRERPALTQNTVIYIHIYIAFFLPAPPSITRVPITGPTMSEYANIAPAHSSTPLPTVSGYGDPQEPHLVLIT
jgi:hypothetical protein